MHRIYRQVLSTRAQSYLAKRQQLDENVDVDAAWKAARQTKTIGMVFDVLLSMAGPRERCMYCVDSHGSDIEHFWPKTCYPSKVFEWSNMLLCCTECGRFKGSKFPLSEVNQPLLVDPSVDDPWDHLDFDPDTGNLTARFDLTSGTPSCKGVATVDILHLDQREAMAEGYRRTFKRITSCVSEALCNADKIDLQKLVDDLRRADDHGLLGWCFGSIGCKFPPFVELRRNAPSVWDACSATQW